jgi:hypothetical protein
MSYTVGKRRQAGLLGYARSLERQMQKYPERLDNLFGKQMETLAKVGSPSKFKPTGLTEVERACHYDSQLMLFRGTGRVMPALRN